MTEHAVLFEERAAGGGKRIAFAQLNAEKSLNALNQTMIDLLRPRLAAWAEDPAIACVVLSGSGDKAFCAGGDIIGLYRAMREHPGGPNPLVERFFETEYRLDYQIHTYPKPILCWGHGIVMGGGLGLMAGASHRVATERSRIAMPELGIGFFPDVGASWFLNRMPGRLGLYLGLTGSTLNATDALYAGLADYFVPAAQRDAVFAALTETVWSNDAEHNHQQLSLLLRGFADASRDARPESKILQHLELIEHVTDYHSVAAILEVLQAGRQDDEWIAAGVKALEYASPIAASVFLEQHRRGRYLSLKEAFQLEFSMAMQFTRRHDFAEGIRALLVDKDRQPRWQPASLAEVSAAEVEAHFQLPADLEPSPLADL